MMRAVMLALLPGTLLSAALFGAGVLVNVVVAVLACLACEALALRLRRRPVTFSLMDGSAALAGWLLALTVTPLLPAWQLVFGCAIAIGLAKHAFGGIGQNPFNPAMVGYLVLLISFPVTMTDWPERAALPLHDVAPVEQRIDALTRQTPLDAWREQRRQLDTEAATRTLSDDAPAAARPPGQRHAAIALAWLAGGLWLLWRGVIAWHIPVALLGTLALGELLLGLVGAASIGPLAAVLSGGAMLGAFFIATDPVSAAATPRGRLVYAAGIAVVALSIRHAGSWPEGIAFGVLLMNGCVPLIDRLSRRAA